jgi:hypothetical protein
MILTVEINSEQDRQTLTRLHNSYREDSGHRHWLWERTYKHPDHPFRPWTGHCAHIEPRDDEEASVIFLKLCAAGLTAWIE